MPRELRDHDVMALFTLICDRYTAVELVEILDLNVRDILDAFGPEVLDNLNEFDELKRDLGYE